MLNLQLRILSAEHYLSTKSPVFVRILEEVNKLHNFLLGLLGTSYVRELDSSPRARQQRVNDGELGTGHLALKAITSHPYSNQKGTKYYSGTYIHISYSYHRFV